MRFYHICGMRNAVFVLLWVCEKVRTFAMSIIKNATLFINGCGVALAMTSGD